MLRSALGSNGQTLLLPHSCLSLLLAAELGGSWHRYLELSLKFSSALCPQEQLGGSYVPSSRDTYTFNCPKMDTHAVGVAYQLAWQTKICIFRTSRPCLSYLVTFSGARDTWTIEVTWAD